MMDLIARLWRLLLLLVVKITQTVTVDTVVTVFTILTIGAVITFAAKITILASEAICAITTEDTVGAPEAIPATAVIEV